MKEPIRAKLDEYDIGMFLVNSHFIVKCCLGRVIFVMQINLSNQRFGLFQQIATLNIPNIVSQMLCWLL